MLKEIALAFWLVAVVYVLIRRGIRAAAIVACADPGRRSVRGWPYAAEIGSMGSCADDRIAGSDRRRAPSIADPRLHVGLRTWVKTVVGKVIGPVLIFAGWSHGGLRRRLARDRSRRSSLVPIAYVVVAIVASFLIRLKEPRFVIAIVPMIGAVDRSPRSIGTRSGPRSGDLGIRDRQADDDRHGPERLASR